MKKILLFALLLASASQASAQKSVVSVARGTYLLDEEAMHTPANLLSSLDSLKQADLHFFTKVKDIPAELKKFYLDTHNEDLFMADKEGNYNCCCDVSDDLPFMQLIYFGYNDNMALLSYNLGQGIIGSQHVMIFALRSKKVTGFWEGRFPWKEDSSGPKNKDVIISVLRADSIEGH